MCYSPIVHADCPCNEVVSIRNRVIGVVPKPSILAIVNLRQTLRRMARYLGVVTPIERDVFYKAYAGSKRRAYEAAAASLDEYPINRRDSRIDMFVKCERINPCEKRNPDPRPISARNKRYVLSIGVWLKPLEHRLYKCKFGFRSRIIVKGMNPTARATLLYKKLGWFDEPICVSLDCSRWDKHVSMELLMLEHAFYNSKCNDPELAKLLSWQLVNRCRTRHGIKYVARGRRMSGDYNTALGNCLLMTTMVITAMEHTGLHYDVMDDGDDCLLILEKRDENVLKMLPTVFLTFGQELKIENVATTPEQVLFCQSKLLYMDPGWKFVRNPVKVLSNASTGFLKLRDARLRRKMLYAVGICELTLNLGVPVLQTFACKLMKLGMECDVRQLLDNAPDYQDMAYRVRGLTLVKDAQDVKVATRLSFTRAFGMSVREQVDTEMVITQWNPDVFDEYEVPYDICHELGVAMDISLTGL